MPARARPTTYAALLRGINLGSHKRVGMADLRTLVESLGCAEVGTYLQSGNVVFRSDRAAVDLTKAIEAVVVEQLGLDVTVVIRTGRQLRALVDGNPFVESKTAEKALYATFLAAKPARERVQSLRSESFEPERFELAGENVYLFFPNGYGRVKLGNAMLERKLGVAATTRNWRTVIALAELASRG